MSNPVLQAGFELGAPLTAPTVSPDPAFGGLSGAYQYKITFVTRYGETTAGPTSSSATPNNGSLLLTNIPIDGIKNAQARRIYRTSSGNTPPFQLVATLDDNITLTYTDITADSDLGVVEPTSNFASSIETDRGWIQASRPIIHSADFSLVATGVDHATSAQISQFAEYIFASVPVSGAGIRMPDITTNMIGMTLRIRNTDAVNTLNVYAHSPSGNVGNGAGVPHAIAPTTSEEFIVSGVNAWQQVGGSGSAGGAVASFSAGTTGLLPNTPIGGNITLTGVVNVASGGLGTTTLAPGGVLYGAGTSPAGVSVGTPGQLLASGGGSAPVWSGTVTYNGSTITGLATPVNPTDTANKAYVDALSTTFNVHKSVRAGATANLTSTYNNGTGGVGATLTNSGAQAALVIDGISVSVNDRILVNNQTLQVQNGVYDVTNIGSGSTNWILTRSADFDNSPTGEIAPGDFVFVEVGNTLASTGWTQIKSGTGPSGSIIVGTDTILFTQFSGAGTFLAGTGINIVGNVISNTGVLSASGGTTGLTFTPSSGSTVLAGTLAVANGGTGNTTNTAASTVNVNITDLNTISIYYPVFAPSTGTGAKPLDINSLSFRYTIGPTPADNCIIFGSTIAIGTTTGAASASAADSVVLGALAFSTGTGSVVLGRQASSSNSNIVVIGNGASGAGSGSTIVGALASASSTDSVAIGSSASASSATSVAVGTLANASGAFSIAIGGSASASAASTITIGNGSFAPAANTLMFGSVSGNSLQTGVSNIVHGNNAFNIGGTFTGQAVPLFNGLGDTGGVASTVLTITTATVGALTVGIPITGPTVISTSSVGSQIVNTTQTTFNVTSTAGFPTAGAFITNDVLGNLLINYTGKTATTFTGCTAPYKTTIAPSTITPLVFIASFGTGTGGLGTYNLNMAISATAGTPIITKPVLIMQSAPTTSAILVSVTSMFFPIQSGSIVTGTGIPVGNRVVSLVKGDLNAPGSMYTLSTGWTNNADPNNFLSNLTVAPTTVTAAASSASGVVIIGTGAGNVTNTNSSVGDGAVMVGRTARANGLGAIALGDDTTSWADGGIVIGASAVSKNAYQIIIGANAQGAEQNNEGIAIGGGSTPWTAIGGTGGAVTNGIRSIAIGNNAICSQNTSFGVAIGYDAHLVQCPWSVAIGASAFITSINQSGVAVGAFAQGSTDSVAIGSGSVVGNGADTVGAGSAVAIGGGHARANGNFGVAVGFGAQTNGIVSAIVLGASTQPTDASHAFAVSINSSSTSAAGLGMTLNGTSRQIAMYPSLSNTIVSSATPVQLLVNSTTLGARMQLITGTSAQTVLLPILPNATATPSNVTNGHVYTIANQSTQTATVVSSATTTYVSGTVSGTPSNIGIVSGFGFAPSGTFINGVNTVSYTGLQTVSTTLASQSGGIGMTAGPLTIYTASTAGFNAGPGAISIVASNGLSVYNYLRSYAAVTITNAVTGSPVAGQVTYTAVNTFIVGDIVTIVGITPVAFNMSNTIIAATGTTFTVASAIVATYVSGGTTVPVFEVCTLATGTVTGGATTTGNAVTAINAFTGCTGPVFTPSGTITGSSMVATLPSGSSTDIILVDINAINANVGWFSTTASAASIPALVTPNNFGAAQKGVSVGGLYRSAINAAVTSSTFAVTSSFVTSGTTLTVTATSGVITTGMFLVGGGVTSGTQIVAQLSGAAGSTGTYQVDQPQISAVAPTSVIFNSTANGDIVYMRTV